MPATKKKSRRWAWIIVIVIITIAVGIIGAISDNESDGSSSSDSNNHSGITTNPADLSYSENPEWVVGSQFMGSTGAETAFKDVEPTISRCERYTSDKGGSIVCVFTWTNTSSHSIDVFSDEQPSVLVAEKINRESTPVSEIMPSSPSPDDNDLPALPDVESIDPEEKYDDIFTFTTADAEGKTPRYVYVEMCQNSKDYEDYLYTTIGILDTTTLEVNQTKGATAE